MALGFATTSQKAFGQQALQLGGVQEILSSLALTSWPTTFGLLGLVLSLFVVWLKVKFTTQSSSHCCPVRSYVAPPLCGAGLAMDWRAVAEQMQPSPRHVQKRSRDASAAGLAVHVSQFMNAGVHDVVFEVELTKCWLAGCAFACLFAYMFQQGRAGLCVCACVRVCVCMCVCGVRVGGGTRACIAGA